MKLVLTVMDKGETMQITGTSTLPSDFKPDETVHVMPEKDKGLFKFIEEKLRTATVEYMKPLSGKLIEEDLIITEYDALEMKKSRYRTRGRNYVSSRLQLTSFFDFFDFINSNNVLLDRGFIITDKNKTEEYLKIVDTGDDDLIEALDDYLTARDHIIQAGGYYKTWKGYERRINEAASSQEIEGVYKEFTQYFE